ncbi:MAG: HutD family protein [Limnohabitans sp.]|nr:HutD family protein [Limnohabitans sp.]
MTQLQDWHQIRLQDTPVSPWKNGGGTTQSLVCWPSPSDWVFRMSVARIDSDGPFSEFKGVDRWFAVLSGEGVVLQFPERRVEVGALITNSMQILCTGSRLTMTLRLNSMTCTCC